MIDLELADGLAVITVNRPESRNALSLAAMAELDKAVDAAAGADALVLTGAGDRAFVSGGDLKELHAIRTEEEVAAVTERMRSVCDRLAAFPTPVIAALNGHAIGGGAELAVAADIRIAAGDIRIAFNQATLGLMPAWGGGERLARLVGPGRALLIAGTGRMLGAAEAAQLGLIDEVLPRAEFAAGWRASARALASRPAREVKRLVTGALPPAEALATFTSLWLSEEHWAALDAVLSRGRGR